MYRTRRTESLILLVGDIIASAIAFPLALMLRYFEVPTSEAIVSLFPAFAVVHGLWIVGFYLFDLYSRQTVAFRRRIFSVLVRAQVLNILVGIVLFYLTQGFGITPKTILVIDGVLVLLLVSLWRIFLLPLFYRSKPLRAVAIGEGHEFGQLRTELTNNPKFNFEIVGASTQELISQEPDVVIVHTREGALSREILTRHVMRGGQVLDASVLYEDIFDRVPLSLVSESWFLANVTGRTRRVYDVLKRLMDIVLASVLLVVLLPLYPIIAILIKLEDGGSVFYGQNRVGSFGALVRMYKFRSMNVKDGGDSVLKSKGHVTRIGSFIRKVRIDELPQLVNVIKGDISLIGPRPEFPALVKEYEQHIPYYGLRHIIKPGLSGWAQIYHREHSHHGAAIKQTRDKLSYDLYYIKNRSIILDIKIALKTVKTVLFFEGA